MRVSAQNRASLSLAFACFTTALVSPAGSRAHEPELVSVAKTWDHAPPHAFTVWMAGAGIRGGVTHGATDDIGFKAVSDRVSVNDLHATILHLVGLDHTKLTYRHNGRDFRLTDVAGDVVRSVLA